MRSLIVIGLIAFTVTQAVHIAIALTFGWPAGFAIGVLAGTATALILDHRYGRP